jgi:hypothetical protein
MPLTTAPLFFDQYAQVLTLTGDVGSVNYPTPGPNDTVLFGVRLATGATGFQYTDLDFNIRDIVGKNSLLQDNSAHYDERLQPYRQTFQQMGVMPAQIVGSKPKQFVILGTGKASIFPKSSGAFNGGTITRQDTFLNFQTGAITGADTTSSNFAGTLPSAGASLVALVSLTSSDTLVVSYGTSGTYAQCLDAIINQTTGGAGSIPAPSGIPIAYVIISSLDGSNVSDIDVYDARAAGINAGSQLSLTPVVSIITSNTTAAPGVNTYFANPSSPASSFTVTLPTAAGVVGVTWTIKNTGFGQSNTVTVALTTNTDKLEGTTNGTYILGPGDTIVVQSDGVNNYNEVTP